MRSASNYQILGEAHGTVPPPHGIPSLRSGIPWPGVLQSIECSCWPTGQLAVFVFQPLRKQAFDGKKAECLAYVRDVREKYASGKYVKYLKSEKDLRQYIPDFKERVEAFYTKYGK